MGEDDFQNNRQNRFATCCHSACDESSKESIRDEHANNENDKDENEGQESIGDGWAWALGTFRTTVTKSWFTDCAQWTSEAILTYATIATRIHSKRRSTGVKFVGTERGAP